MQALVCPGLSDGLEGLEVLHVLGDGLGTLPLDYKIKIHFRLIWLLLSYKQTLPKKNRKIKVFLLYSHVEKKLRLC